MREIREEWSATLQRYGRSGQLDERDTGGVVSYITEIWEEWSAR